MKLVKVSDTVYVNPEYVQLVELQTSAGFVTVAMRGGLLYDVKRAGNESLEDTFLATIKELTE